MTKTGENNDIFFMKMHGLGNDFVVIDSREGDAVMTPALARLIADRRRGVGFDQLAEIRPGYSSDISLDFWNADGSRAGACGNATRCVAQFVMATNGVKRLSIRTARGILQAVLTPGGQISVNMGQPILQWDAIPLSADIDSLHLPMPGDPVAVGMGNPHCVFFVDDVLLSDVERLGAQFEHDPLFPQSTNVEFVQVRARDDIRMRVWERGTGVTLACGSGACAAAVAAHQRGLTDRCVNIQVDGGWLSVDWRDDGIWMSGATEHVFDGTLTRSFLGHL